MKEDNENLFGSAAWNAFSQEFDEDSEKDFEEEIELESDKIEVKNTPVEELKSSKQTLLRLDIDKSGSMQGFTEEMKKALESLKKSILTSKEVHRIQISKTLFAENVVPEGYSDAESFNTDYTASSGRTKLYDSIIDSERRIRQYIDELNSKGAIATAVLCILSDGVDNASEASFDDAKESVRRMIERNVTVCFIAFGNKRCEMLAENLGIKNVVKTDATIHDLHKIMNFVSLGTIKKSEGNDK